MKKSLICITTCNRLSEVKKYIWDYLRFINSNKEFHFVLALDGNDQSYIDFCHEFDIPLIYSEEREGVGLSKNRVLTQFPEYKYYFFIEDDVELLDSSIFNHCIEVYKKTGYPHLCGNFSHELFDVEIKGPYRLDKSYSGSAHFAFYSKIELDQVGGWNILFAKYKRFGHTEHTYRFYHTELQPAPFIYPNEFEKMLMIHNPECVSKLANIKTDENELIEEERELINSKSKHFPLMVLSTVYFNKKQLGHNQNASYFLLENKKKYPLTKGLERKRAFGNFYALQISKKDNMLFKNILLATKSMLFSPMNNELKHALKYYFKK